MIKWALLLFCMAISCLCTDIINAEKHLQHELSDSIITISSTTIKQGGLFRLEIRTPDSTTEASFTLNAQSFKLINKGTYHHVHQNHFMGFGAVSRYTKPGEYPLVVTLKRRKGGPKTITKMMTVTDAEYPFGRVTLTPKKQAIKNNKPKGRNEAAFLGKHFKTYTSERLFKKPFIRPTEGRVSSVFGSYRLYNGKAGSRHSGLDISNDIGTPIYATNDGKVIVSESLYTHGDTIMIDHGLGITSVYCHMNSRSVTVGDTVQQKTPIGTMGDTGVATGSHLHWGMSIQGVRVDPELVEEFSGLVE